LLEKNYDIHSFVFIESELSRLRSRSSAFYQHSHLFPFP